MIWINHQVVKIWMKQTVNFGVFSSRCKECDPDSLF